MANTLPLQGENLGSNPNQSTKIIRRRCPMCQKGFGALVSEVRRGKGIFCSLSCSSKRKRTAKANVTCAYCDKEFYKNPSKQKNSKSGLFFCCREHKDLAQRIGGIKEIQPPHYDRGSHNTRYRTVALRILPSRCNRCGYEEHVEILQVHHKDRDRANNAIQNLEILCPNCHAIEHRITNKWWEQS